MGAEAGARKVVTIVFADLVGSTALHEQLDAESAQRVMERYYDTLRAVVDAHGGTVVKLLGDGVMAAFGLKRVAEDDAIRAVHCAVAMQHAFRELVSAQTSLAAAGLRIAVNTGEVVVSGALDDVIGDPVNVAARLQEQGRNGDVVVGEATRRLVATRITLTSLGSVTLKGRAEAVGAYRVESLEAPAGATATPFVGREEEVTRLAAVFDAAVAAPTARLAVLLGSPGLGKSRLIDELGRRLGDGVALLTAHCDAAGGATFAPIAAALRAVLRIDAAADVDAARAAVEAALASEESAERARIAGGIATLLAGSPASPEETFFVVRRLLAALARETPVVLVIDDVHWAEPLLLDLVEHLIQWGSGVKLFVLVAARPELRGVRSSLVVPGGLVSEVVTLGGLDAGAAMRLAASVIGASDLPAAIAGKVLATSEGNPLFVGELVRMLVQEGALAKQGERWTASAELAAIEMPPTIHALLAARIERLRPEERTVLERAAVVGRHFSRSAVGALLGQNGSELDTRLEALRRSELIERDSGWLLGEPALRFHHVLIRDAAYRRLLKGTRAELHERLADWIEARVGDAAEHDETIGRHLEQAHQLLSELGPVGTHGKALGERAAQRLAAAGRKALARDDVPLAAGLLGRAIERLEVSDDARADLALDWCEALLSASDVGRAATAIAELDRFATHSERLRGWHTCFAAQLAVMTAPEELHAAAERVAVAARDLAKLEDAAGEAKAHFVHAQALARLGKVGACEAALDQALAAARRAGDRRRANAVLAGAPLAALWGPSPVTRASGRCLDVVRVLRITQGAPAVEAVALSCQGVLEALRGRTDAARRMLASSRTMVEELGITQRVYEVDAFIGRVDLLEGNAAAAEQKLRPAYEGFRELGLGSDAARAAALLGRALLADGRANEAESLSHEAEQLAGDDLQAAIAWRGVRAEALAARGEHDAAIALAKAAVDIAAATDALLDHADARVALAVALRAAGRDAEADAASRSAIELWQTKGATLLVDKAPHASARPRHASGAKPRQEGSAPARRVRSNAAAAATQRFEAAMAARDEQALAGLFGAALEVIDHQNGVTYGLAGHLDSLARLLRMRDVRFGVEPLATFGERLVLWRRRIHASGAGGGRYDVGDVDREEIVLFELNDAATIEHIEIFAGNRLSHAVSRLYQRYAAELPDGAEQRRAVAISDAVPLRDEIHREELVATFGTSFVEAVDHRSLGAWSAQGREAMLSQWQWQENLAEGLTARADDILALVPGTHLLHLTFSGVDRSSGGTFETPVLMLSQFGHDGRVTALEIFEPEQAARALARFDELAGCVALPAARRRPVRHNFAIEEARRIEAVLAARDVGALGTVYRRDLVFVDHQVGLTYGYEETHERLRIQIEESANSVFVHQPLATLGESLGLVRLRSTASASMLYGTSTGATEASYLLVIEADEEGKARRIELFNEDKLDDALVRLYERHAELLPQGTERARAACAAAAIAAMPFHSLAGRDRRETAFALDVEVIDHRVVGQGKVNGRSAVLDAMDAFLDLVESMRWRVDDVLAFTERVIVFRATNFGTSRIGGGVFERVVHFVNGFDADGRIARLELFEADAGAAALARFDELVSAKPARRRVRANVASRGCERFAATLTAGDADALAQHLDESLRLVHHPTGTTYGRRGMLTTWRSALKAERLEFRRETLATLGETLALSGQVTTVEGLSEAHLNAFGPTEVHEISLVKTDAKGRMLLAEVFAPDHLGQALARLYELYAERLPDGPARARAAWISRSIASFDGPIDLDRMATAYGPTSHIADYRVLGTWSSRGDEILGHWRLQRQLAPDFSGRYDDVLAASTDAVVARMTFFGTGGDSGGTFENKICVLFMFDVDGRVGCSHTFEAEDEARALALFDEMTAGRAQTEQARRTRRRPVRPNRATRNAAALEAAFDRRDLAAIEELLGDPLETIEHPTHTTYGRAGQIETCKSTLRIPDLAFRAEPLATLGDSLALVRRRVTASGTAGSRFDVGAYEIESILVNEVDEAGRLRRSEVFAADHLRTAIVSLYTRYTDSLPEGPERRRAVGVAQTLRTLKNEFTDADLIVSRHARDFVCVDHRKLATWSAANLEEWRAHWRVQNDLAADFRLRDDDILALEPSGMAVRETFYGTSRESGGLFENVMLSVFAHDAEGLITRTEVFESHQEAEALECFDEIVGGTTAKATPAEHPLANANARRGQRIRKCWRERDWDGFAALLAPGFRFDDRRAMSRVELDREQYVAFSRQFGDMASADLGSDLLATRGERLSMTRVRLEVAGGDVGPSDLDYIYVFEADETGDRYVAAIAFDSSDLDAAYAELDERWWTSEATAYPSARAYSLEFGRAIAARDWQAIAGLHAPTLVARDHRLVGWDVLEGPDAIVGALRTMVELAPDVESRLDHVRFSDRGLVAEVVWIGTRDGGVFESAFVWVVEFDADGRARRLDFFDPHHVDRAFAKFEEIGRGRVTTSSIERFEQLRPDPLRIPPNAASRAWDRWQAAIAARDLEAVRSLYNPSHRFEDRRRLVQTTVDLEGALGTDRFLIDGHWRAERTVLSTLGDRLVLQRVIWTTGEAGGESEIEVLTLDEVDANGRYVRYVIFDPDDRAAASAAMFERYAASAEGPLRVSLEIIRAWHTHDLERLRALLPADFYLDDRRRTGVGRLDGVDAYLASLAAVWELSRDLRIETLYVISVEPHRALWVNRWFGTNAEGGEFESVYVCMALARGDRPVGLEIFEVDDLDAAQARFEALGESRQA